VPPRRQKGEGSIHLRGDGRWMGSFEVDSPLGRRRKYVYAKTQRDCARALAEARREYERTGSLVANVTVKDWLDHWLDGLQQDKAVRARTLESGYRSKMGNVADLIGTVRLDKLTADHVKGVYRTLADRGMARSSIVQTHRILARAIKDAYQDGKVGRNVMELVKTPKVGNAAKQTEHMTAAEVRKVLGQLVGDRLAARWLFQITLGPRQSEVLGLGWEDVDLEAERVTIRRKVERQRGKGLVFDEPKSKTSTRSLALPPLLLAALQARHDRWLTEPRPELAGDLAPHALVFGRPDGLPYDNKADRKAWRELLKRAGVNTAYGTHSARHGLATLMANRNVPVKVLQGILGHADPSLTLRVYAGLEDNAQRQALEMAEAEMWSDH
jgi:integrase